MGKLSDSVEAGEGASNQLQGSSKFDAPTLISVLDIEQLSRITNLLFPDIVQKHIGPTGKKPVGLNESLIAAAARDLAGNVPDLCLSEQLAYPIVTGSPSTRRSVPLPFFADG